MTSSRTNRRPSFSAAVAALKARNPQSFDSRGECEHMTVARQRDGRPVLIWSVRDECIWCGTGREWR